MCVGNIYATSSSSSGRERGRGDYCLNIFAKKPKSLWSDVSRSIMCSLPRYRFNDYTFLYFYPPKRRHGRSSSELPNTVLYTRYNNNIMLHIFHVHDTLCWTSCAQYTLSTHDITQKHKLYDTQCYHTCYEIRFCEINVKKLINNSIPFFGSIYNDPKKQSSEKLRTKRFALVDKILLCCLDPDESECIL